MMVPNAPLVGLLNFTHFVATAGYGAIFVLCLLQSCCVPTSSELTLGLAGALAAQGKLSLVAVILVGTLGEVVGAYVAWLVGRYAGRAAVDRFGRSILVSHRDLDRAEAWYERHERFGVLGSRLLPVIRNFVALPAGIAEVPLLRFGLLTAGGSLVWDGAWAGIGYGVGTHWHAIAKGFGDIGYVLGALALAALAYGVFHRYRNYKEGAAERADGPSGSLGRSTTGTRRWVGGSSGSDPERTPLPGATIRARRERPPEFHRVSRSEPGPDRWLAGTTGRTQSHDRAAIPDSPLATWEAAVTRGRTAPTGRSASLVHHDEGGVEANGRLTAMLGAVLLVLLAIEGATLLHLGTLLTLHVVIGMILIPIIMLKIGSTTWRFARYYMGSPEYRRKGPPPALLRLLGPLVVVFSIAVLASGIALLFAPGDLRNELLFIHKVTFILWFAAMVVHVLGHILDVARLAPRDFYWRTRRQIAGAGTRQWAIVSAVAIGILLALAIAPKVGPWLAGRQPGHTAVHVHATSAAAPAASRH
jgi:membrane protein DedA with SNARE-associated domain